MKLLLRKNIALLITITVIITVCIQVYWNIQNYRNNKQQIISAVQVAFDNCVNNYFNEKAKLNFIQSGVFQFPLVTLSGIPNETKAFKVPKSDINHDSFSYKTDNTYIFNKKDSILNIKNLQHLAQKVIVSVIEDNVNLNKVAFYLNEEFERKHLNFDFAIFLKLNNTIINTYNNPLDQKYTFNAISKSAYLPSNSELKLVYPDIFLKSLKEGLTGIILSFLFFICIILCLFYLLSVIRQQKQLAIIKNDFISNISHELKTPIAVVSTALEGIENFNDDNKPEKIKKYMNISKQHLTKLSEIVEKILETSALESDKLQLQTTNTNIIQLINHTIEKLKINTTKTILLKTTKQEIHAKVDSFHFENVISNLIDNAIKYGGNKILITVNEVAQMITIEVSDNGKNIEKIHRQKIFDKFYRIPKNNLHNEKGFGIGLYYAKNIIEKHGGKLELITDENTTFKISITHG